MIYVWKERNVAASNEIFRSIDPFASNYLARQIFPNIVILNSEIRTSLSCHVSQKSVNSSHYF